MDLNKIIQFAIGPLVVGILGFVVAPLSAWLFSPEDVGRLNMLQITISLGLLISVLGLDAAFVREYHGSSDIPALFKACFLPGFLILFLGSILAGMYGTDISFWLFEDSNQIIFPMVIVAIIGTYLSRFLSLILRMEERGLAYSMSEIIPRATQLVLFGVVFLFDVSRDFTTLLSISLVSIIGISIVNAINTRDFWRAGLHAKVSVELQKSLLGYGIPLVFSGMAYWALTATSSILLRSNSTFSELGIYSVVNSFAAIAAIIQSIFTVVWAPIVYKWVNKRVDFSQIDTVTHLALGAICLIFCLVGLFSWIIDYMLPVYYINVKYLIACAVAPSLLYMLTEITSVGISISRKTSLTIWVALSAFLINIILGSWLISDYGAKGAVIANTLAYIIFFVGRTELSARVWRRFSRIRIYTYIGLMTLLSIITALLGPAWPFHYSIVWLLTLPIIIFSFSGELRLGLSFLKNKSVVGSELFK